MSYSRMHLSRVLVIDQDETVTFLIKAWLQARGLEVTTLTGDLADWRPQLVRGFEAVICDDRLPQLPPEEMLQIWKSLNQDGFIIFMGHDPDPERLLNLIIDGAFTYLSKPVTEEKLLQALSQGQQNRQVLQEILGLSEELLQANLKLQRQAQRLQAERQRRIEQKMELSFVNSFSYALSSTLEPVKLATIIAERLGQLVNFTFMGLDWRPDPGVRKIFLSSALDPEGQEKFIHQLQSQGPSSWVSELNSPEMIIFQCRGRPPQITQPPQYQQHFPLDIAGAPVGLLVLAGDRPLSLSPNQGKILRTLIPSMALAMKNALAHEYLGNLAKYDALTQVMNRRMFDHHFKKEFSASRRYGYPLAFMLLDLDQFKMINDRYGHLAGDEVLKQVAGLLKSEIRESDHLARYGGDEFALILPHTTLKEAIKLARRLQHRLRQGYFSNGLALKITISVGLVDTQQISGADQEEMLRKADQALYLAKLKGRNAIHTGSVRELADHQLSLGSPGMQLSDHKLTPPV